MISNAAGSGRLSNLLRRRSVLFGCVVLVPLFAVLLLASVSVFEGSAGTGFVSFTCHSSLRDRTFTIPVEVNLADGMNLEEAKAVAIAAFDEAVEMDEGGLLRDFRIDASFVNGKWNLRLSVIFSSHVHGPSRDNAYEGGVVTGVPSMTMTVDQFLVTIDPNTRVISFLEPLVPID